MGALEILLQNKLKKQEEQRQRNLDAAGKFIASTGEGPSSNPALAAFLKQSGFGKDDIEAFDFAAQAVQSDPGFQAQQLFNQFLSAPVPGTPGEPSPGLADLPPELEGARATIQSPATPDVRRERVQQFTEQYPGATALVSPPAAQAGLSTRQVELAEEEAPVRIQQLRQGIQESQVRILQIQDQMAGEIPAAERKSLAREQAQLNLKLTKEQIELANARATAALTPQSTQPEDIRASLGRLNKAISDTKVLNVIKEGGNVAKGAGAVLRSRNSLIASELTYLLGSKAISKPQLDAALQSVQVLDGKKLVSLADVLADPDMAQRLDEMKGLPPQIGQLLALSSQATTPTGAAIIANEIEEELTKPRPTTPTAQPETDLKPVVSVFSSSPEFVNNFGRVQVIAQRYRRDQIGQPEVQAKLIDLGLDEDSAAILSESPATLDRFITEAAPTMSQQATQQASEAQQAAIEAQKQEGLRKVLPQLRDGIISAQRAIIILTTRYGFSKKEAQAAIQEKNNAPGPGTRQ